MIKKILQPATHDIFVYFHYTNQMLKKKDLSYS